MIFSQADFGAYISAFNAADFDQFSSYYTENVVIHLNPQKTIEGRQAAAEFFKEQRKLVGEAITLRHVVLDQTGIAIQATVKFTARVNLLDGYFTMPPILKGEGYIVAYLIMYTLDDERKIASIRAVRDGPPVVTK